MDMIRMTSNITDSAKRVAFYRELAWKIKVIEQKNTFPALQTVHLFHTYTQVPIHLEHITLTIRAKINKL